MDKETVITHLQIIHTWASFARERDLQFFTPKHLEDIAQWSDDAISMLKEQETKLICNLLGGQPYEVYCKECRTILCVLGKDETMNDVKSVFSYCPHCGRSVKWE